MLKVKVENPAALHFILQDDIYLLNQDKARYLTVLKTEPGIKTEPVNFNYLGGNKKNFLILAAYAGHGHILNTHLIALESVLKRKDLSLEDVAIINLNAHAAIGFELLNNYFKPATLLILGQNALPAGLDEPVLNTPVNINGISVLYTFSFDEMMGSNEYKKVFWDQVKTL